MPYSPPTSTIITTPPAVLPSPSPSSPSTPSPTSPGSIGRPTHRRSYSSISFTNEASGPGAFKPLTVPRRNSHAAVSTAPTNPHSRGGAAVSVRSGSPAPKFHFRGQSGSQSDDDDDSSDESSSGSSSSDTPPHLRAMRGHPKQLDVETVEPEDEDEEDDELNVHAPPLKLRPRNSFNISLQNRVRTHGNAGSQKPTVHLPPHVDTQVPFPRSSPLGSPILPTPTTAATDSITPPPSAGAARSPNISLSLRPPLIQSVSMTPIPSPAHIAAPNPARPVYARTNSTPILLSNGKPLKSSLKTASRSCSTSDVTQLSIPGAHQRAASAPTTPGLTFALASPPLSASASNSAVTSPSISATNSAYATPLMSPSSEAGSIGSSGTLATTPKNVHFPSLSSDLENIRVFSRSARPASVSLQGGRSAGKGEDTETETEGENSATGSNSWWYPGNWMSGVTGARANGSFPFPRMPQASGSGMGRPSASPLRKRTSPPGSGTEADNKGKKLQVDSAVASSIPHAGHFRDGAKVKKETNVFLENVYVSGDAAHSADSPDKHASPTPSPGAPAFGYMHGTILVRNISYEKHLFVRFTTDDWGTVSEVGASWLESVDKEGVAKIVRDCQGLSQSQVQAQVRRTVGDIIAATSSGFEDVEEDTDKWDRFSFSIRLSDYAYSLGLGSSRPSKPLFLVVRYTVPGKGEWWDNNGGGNFKVGFAFVAPKLSPPVPSPNQEPVLEGRQPNGDEPGRHRAHSSPAAIPSTSPLMSPTIGAQAPVTSPSERHALTHAVTNATYSRLMKAGLRSTLGMGSGNYAMPTTATVATTAAAEATTAPVTPASTKEAQGLGLEFPSPQEGGDALKVEITPASPPSTSPDTASTVSAGTKTSNRSPTSDPPAAGVKLTPTTSGGGITLYWPWSQGQKRSDDVAVSLPSPTHGQTHKEDSPTPTPLDGDETVGFFGTLASRRRRSPPAIPRSSSPPPPSALPALEPDGDVDEHTRNSSSSSLSSLSDYGFSEPSYTGYVNTGPGSLSPLIVDSPGTDRRGQLSPADIPIPFSPTRPQASPTTPTSVQSQHAVPSPMSSSQQPNSIPPTTDNTPKPPPLTSIDSDALYQAFVKQWCFAGSPGSSPSAAPQSSSIISPNLPTPAMPPTPRGRGVTGFGNFFMNMGNGSGSPTGMEGIEA